jgi:hypothetical protein
MWPEKDEPGRLVDDRVEERSVSSNGGVGWRWPGLFEAEGGAGGGFGAVLVDGDVRPIDGLAQKDSGCDAAVAATGNLDTELLERFGEIDAGVEVPLSRARGRRPRWSARCRCGPTLKRRAAARAR